jgi:hypothetical protein
MTTTKATAADYWGYLIKSDNTPSSLLQELLLGIANYIVSFYRSHDTSLHREEYALTRLKHTGQGHCAMAFAMPCSRKAGYILSPRRG